MVSVRVSKDLRSQKVEMEILVKEEWDIWQEL